MRLNRLKYTAFMLCVFGAQHLAQGQEDWMTFPAQKKDTNKVKHVELQFGAQKGKVTLHQDSRIDKISEFVRTGEETMEGIQIDGYRIVVFFDQDKTKVAQQKANFLARYNEHEAYVEYVAPNYRVRVGNFRTRLEAEALKSELLAYFPTAVVVEDKIQLPPLPSETVTE